MNDIDGRTINEIDGEKARQENRFYVYSRTDEIFEDFDVQFGSMLISLTTEYYEQWS